MVENVGVPKNIDWKKMGFLFLGIALFTVVYLSPLWPDAVDPMGKQFPLNREAKGAIAVFLLAPPGGFSKSYPSASPAWPSESCRPCF